MTKKEIKIRTVSYVHVGDRLVSTDELTKEQKAKLGTELKVGYLNGLFRGQAEFYPAGSRTI